MTVDELLESTQKESAPPAGLSPEIQSLWLSKTDNWEAAHKIAQEIDSPMGSWIHAHLHVIEGDLANAAYWYNRAGRKARGPKELDEEWRELVEVAIDMG